MAEVSSRITVEPDKGGGKPCIRGRRITEWDVPGRLGAGMNETQILEHTDFETEDFQAVYPYAARGWHRCFRESRRSGTSAG